VVKNIVPLLKPIDIKIGITPIQLEALIGFYKLTKNRYFLLKLIDYFEYLPNEIKTQVRIRIKKMIKNDIKNDTKGKISSTKGTATERFQFQAIFSAMDTISLMAEKKLSQEKAIAKLIIKNSSGRALSYERKKKLVLAGLKDIKKHFQE